jgi:hypothetical protein
MTRILAPLALLLLCACAGERSNFATYTCPNGPSLAVTTTDSSARIAFPSGRVEELAATETSGVYAKPGIVFDTRGFRDARLTDGDQSFACNQMAG